MKIPLKEPATARYIYINPKNNYVHLLVPVVSGVSIGLDNTCKSVYSLQSFFSNDNTNKVPSAMMELERYKEALEFDISLINDFPKLMDLKKQKLARLQQVEAYLNALAEIQNSEALNSLCQLFPVYPEPLQAIMREKNTNLYSMVLRPAQEDLYLRTVNPVFSVEHSVIGSGDVWINTKSSLFYATLYATLKNLKVDIQSARTHLTTAIHAFLEGENSEFSAIQHALTTKTKELLGISVDFNKTSKNEVVSRDVIDTLMKFDDSATASDYIDALLGYCAPNLFDTILESPFSSVNTSEKLSLVIQFFLAHVNIYCVAQGLGDKNFGELLDKSGDLSNTVAKNVLSALEDKANIEESLLAVVNDNKETFHVKRPLTIKEATSIKQTFTAHWVQIKNSPQFDEFMVLDTNKPGPFVSYQGSICTDFCEFFSRFPKVTNTYQFQRIRDDFKTLNGVLSNNDFIKTEFELDVKAIQQFKDDKRNKFLSRLPEVTRQSIFKSNPEMALLFILPDFLLHVARGEQNEAEHFLNAKQLNTQQLLLTTGKFTDYSGRTFTCTALEYAYWAKDAHMCRMLEKYMENDTRKKMLERMHVIENHGLTYQKFNKSYVSTHFSFQPLIEALKQYINILNTDDASEKSLKGARIDLGKAQREFPAHVAQEYCWPDRSFSPCPEFNELNMSRDLTYLCESKNRTERWFPLHGPQSGLGFDFALSRPLDKAKGLTSLLEKSPGWVKIHQKEMEAMIKLDKVRSAEVEQLNERLESGLSDIGFKP